eukprot:COSAG02_NODE_66228_length_256_cov_0.636943_1_plen_28_part_01
MPVIMQCKSGRPIWHLLYAPRFMREVLR